MKVMNSLFVIVLIILLCTGCGEQPIQVQSINAETELVSKITCDGPISQEVLYVYSNNHSECQDNICTVPGPSFYMALNQHNQFGVTLGQDVKITGHMVGAFCQTEDHHLDVIWTSSQGDNGKSIQVEQSLIDEFIKASTAK